MEAELRNNEADLRRVKASIELASGHPSHLFHLVLYVDLSVASKYHDSGGGFRIGCLICPRLSPSLSGGDPTTVLAAGECGAFALRHRLPEAWLEGPGQRHNEMDDFEAFGPHEKWIYIL